MVDLIGQYLLTFGIPCPWDRQTDRQTESKAETEEKGSRQLLSRPYQVQNKQRTLKS
jgi:hypothetical protein